MVEFDLLMIKILEVYTIQKEVMKNHLKYLFYAADVPLKIMVLLKINIIQAKPRSIHWTLWIYINLSAHWKR